MKKKTINLILKFVRYLIPAVIGWIEGDTHAVVDSLSAMFALF